MAQITYSNKSTMNENADIPAVNKGMAQDWNEIKTVTNGNDTQLANYFSARYKTLWTGTWSSGSITVSGVSGYHSIIVMVDTNDPIMCYKSNSGNNFRGATIIGSASANNQYAKVFDCAISGDTLTWNYSKELGHNASGNHNSGSSKTVSKIIGVDPIINWS